MEIMNCEQYVLGELEKAKATIDKLEQENDRLQDQCELLEIQLNAMTKVAKSYRETIDRPKTPIEELADRVMHEAMLARFFYADVTSARNALTGQTLGFDEWCREAMRLRRETDDIGDGEIIAFLHDDLKAIYDKKVKG